MILGLGMLAISGIAQAQAPAITIVYPEPSSSMPYDYNTYYDITVSANQSITSFEAATLSYNAENITLNKDYAGLNGPEDGYFIQLKVSTPGMTNYVKQAVTAGADSFTIVITGVKCGDTLVTGNSTDNGNVVVDNGTVTLTYSIANPPLYMAEQSTWPAKFLNYWEPGDPDAVATLVFSENVESVFEAKVIMGQVKVGSENGEAQYPEYALEPKFDGNKMIIDFAGVNYEPSGNISNVTVLIINVTGENGLPADFDGSVYLNEYIPFGGTVSGGEGSGGGTTPGDGPSGVNSIQKVENDVDVIYNLKGEKVNPNNIVPGIYIVNGQKVKL